MDKIKELKAEQDALIVEAEKLREDYKRLYADLDISEPVSSQERELTRKIAGIWSRVNILTREIRQLKYGK